MSWLCTLWLKLLRRDRTVNSHVYGCLFCTECELAGGDRCTVKNRTVRPESRACSGFVMSTTTKEEAL